MPARKQTYHHHNLRQTLVEAAVPLLAAGEQADLSLRAVARAAGVSHAAPYRHFRDKADLLEAIAAEGYRQLETGCVKAEEKYADDPRRQFIEAGMAYLFFVVEQPAIARLMFGGSLPAATRGISLQQAVDQAVGALMRIIDSGKRAGLYRDRPTRDLTLSALAGVHGLAMMISAGLVTEGRWTRAKLRRLGETVAETVLEGMIKDKQKQ